MCACNGNVQGALTFPDFVAQRCCNPCCKNSRPVGGTSTSNPICSCTCTCTTAGSNSSGTVAGTSAGSGQTMGCRRCCGCTGCGCTGCGNVCGTSTGCRACGCGSCQNARV